MAPARTETVTGTTTASRLAVVVGVVAAGEVAAGLETQGANVATLATGPTRYGNFFCPSYLLPFYTIKSRGSLSAVCSQCLTPVPLSPHNCLFYSSLLSMVSNQY